MGPLSLARTMRLKEIVTKYVPGLDSINVISNLYAEL